MIGIAMIDFVIVLGASVVVDDDVDVLFGQKL